MKNLYFLLFTITFITICCRQEGDPPLNGPCGNGFIANAENTKCLCPEATHYLFASGRECTPKSQFTYRIKASSNNCIGNISLSTFQKDTSGVIWLRYPMGPNGIGINYGSSEHSGINFFSNENSLVQLPDGRWELKFKSAVFAKSDCPQWEHISSKAAIYCEGHGVSNKENTKMDIITVYKDWDGLILDTGFLYLWKD